MVRAIFFGHVEGARTVAAFANLPETTSGLITMRQRLIAWKNFKERSDYPTWIMADIRATRETTEREIRRKRERLETDVERSIQHGVVIQTPYVYSEPDGRKMIGVTTRLTKDVTTMARRNEQGEFEVMAIPNEDYQKLLRKRREDTISKVLFWTGTVVAGILAYLEGSPWLGIICVLQIGILRLLHKITINLNPVFKAFEGAEHTDVVLKFFEDIKKVIIDKLAKVENGVQNLMGHNST